MDKIEVKILDKNFNGTPLFLARMTQRGHIIKSMDDLQELYDECKPKMPSEQFMSLPHETIFRHNTMTVAICGLSTKAVSQLRTHATRATFMSTSTQYSEFTLVEDPYVIPEAIANNDEARKEYVKALKQVHDSYSKIYHLTNDKDAAGYLLPQSLRKCLVIHANYPAWKYILKTRLCNRNTKEVQYICEEILKAMTKECGKSWADLCLPPCTTGKCEEGKFSCGHKYVDKREAELEN